MSEATPLPHDSPEALAATIATIGEKVVEALRTVNDPEISVNIYDLGLIYKIDINPIADGKYDIHINMTLTTVGCPVAGMMPGMVQNAVKDISEVNDVTVDLVWSPPWEKSMMSDEAKLKLNMF
ncbi:MAG: iron-sulfur cluster assembly protein [Alphaproteobacteria bacterium]